jgi:hypothetical protein
LLSWVLVELVDDGIVLHGEYETEAEAEAVQWEMLDDAPSPEQRDRLSNVLSVVERR